MSDVGRGRLKVPPLRRGKWQPNFAIPAIQSASYKKQARNRKKEERPEKKKRKSSQQLAEKVEKVLRNFCNYFSVLML